MLLEHFEYAMSTIVTSRQRPHQLASEFWCFRINFELPCKCLCKNYACFQWQFSQLRTFFCSVSKELFSPASIFLEGRNVTKCLGASFQTSHLRPGCFQSVNRCCSCRAKTLKAKTILSTSNTNLQHLFGALHTVSRQLRHEEATFTFLDVKFLSKLNTHRGYTRSYEEKSHKLKQQYNVVHPHTAQRRKSLHSCILTNARALLVLRNIKHYHSILIISTLKYVIDTFNPWINVTAVRKRSQINPARLRETLVPCPRVISKLMEAIHDLLVQRIVHFVVVDLEERFWIFDNA